MSLKRSLDYLVYVVARLFVCLIQAIGVESSRTLARPLVRLAADVLRIRGKVLDDNLSHAFPSLSAHQRRMLARRHWEHLCLMMIEIAHAHRKIHRTNWRQHVRFHNKRALVEQMLSERPIVLLSGHFGNFEVGGQVVGMFGFPTFTVARPIANPFLDRFINSFRTANGQIVLTKTGSSEAVERMLNGGGALVVLGDQAAGPKGIWVDFFGRPASTHKAIALYSLGYSAPLVVTYAKRRPGSLQFEIGCEAVADPLETAAHCQDTRDLTHWFTQRLEDLVRRAPEQYWWLHRRWKNPPKWKGKRQRRKKKLAA